MCPLASSWMLRFFRYAQLLEQFQSNVYDSSCSWENAIANLTQSSFLPIPAHATQGRLSLCLTPLVWSFLRLIWPENHANAGLWGRSYTRFGIPLTGDFQVSLLQVVLIFLSNIIWFSYLHKSWYSNAGIGEGLSEVPFLHNSVMWEIQVWFNLLYTISSSFHH